MQSNTGNHGDSPARVDSEELSRAQQLWHNFTQFIKWGIIVCAAVLILLGLVTL